jgi:ketosteroid isomerase-like protein
MSRENVGIVSRIYDALKDDDLDAALELMDPNVEYVNPDYAVDSGTRRGHAGIRANVENMRLSFDYWRFEPEELIDLEDQVVAVGTFRATGRSGLEIERRQSRLWTLSGGKVVRYQWFDSETEGLEAAGRG